MAKAINYREKAADLRQQAGQGENAHIRDQLLRIATQYDNLAATMEGMAGQTPKR
jgi:hypothetical protein